MILLNIIFHLYYYPLVHISNSFFYISLTHIDHFLGHYLLLALLHSHDLLSLLFLYAFYIILFYYSITLRVASSPSTSIHILISQIWSISKFLSNIYNPSTMINGVSDETRIESQTGSFSSWLKIGNLVSFFSYIDIIFILNLSQSNVKGAPLLLIPSSERNFR